MKVKIKSELNILNFLFSVGILNCKSVNFVGSVFTNCIANH